MEQVGADVPAVDSNAGPCGIHVGRVKGRREHGDSGKADQVSGGRGSRRRRLISGLGLYY